ncbi:MAG: SIS domain-containing protein, partial [Candidatus Hydrogenedentota bacterium]
IKLLGRSITGQREQIEAAADIVARSVMADGVIHIFGTGHSSLIAQEAFMRAGGLLPVNAMLDQRVLLSGGALNSSAREKQEGLAAEILDAHDIRSRDAGVVVSNSGRNAAPVEMAFEMRQRGIPVIAITSVRHSGSVKPSHASGKKLMDLADVVLDNGAPPGDALVELSGLVTNMGAASTVTGAAIINSVFILAAERMLAVGAEPIALPSGNVEAADYARIQAAMGKYLGRIKYL